MILVGYLQWWVTAGWRWQWRRTVRLPARLSRAFDVPTLVKTLFKPWKRIGSFARPGDTLPIRLRKMVDNIISRVVGFVVRLLALLVLVLGVLLGSIGYAVLGAVWPLLPFVPLGLIALGFTWLI